MVDVLVLTVSNRYSVLGSRKQGIENDIIPLALFLQSCLILSNAHMYE